jgi:bidirectional [NiFe] hydrogenase diaphorase subunit
LTEKQVSAEEGATILEAATDAGIKIPTLCHLDGVYDVGACRLCLVEVTGVPSCCPPARPRSAEGMEVKTDSERLRKYRRMTLELLFAERNHVCAVCVANGHCELQTLAYSQGMDHVRYDYCFPKWSVDATHRLFGMDHNRCILCTRCVRVCWHIEGAGTKNVSGRGGKSKIITDLNQPWGDSETCTSCGKCVMSCPTGALFHKGSTVVRNGTRPHQTRIHRQRPGEKTMDRLKYSHSLAGRLLRLPHVVPRPGRVPDRTRRQGGPGLQPGHGREGISGKRGRVPHRRRRLQRGQPGNPPQIRARTKVLVSFGDCAVTGNVPAIRNQLGAGNVPRTSCSAPTSRTRRTIQSVPKADGIVPQLLERVMPVHEVVHVDTFLPGCPPPATASRRSWSRCWPAARRRNWKGRTAQI